MADVTGRRSRRRKEPDEPRKSPQGGVLALFAVMLLAATLAFGAVDRLIQLGLILFFVLALLVQPPTLPTLGRRTNLLFLLLLVILVAKEFAPAQWFGLPPWRTTVEESYGIALPWTHHPEPGRAVDALIAGALGLLWFLWVRTISAQRENRAWIAWILFSVAGVVAVVSFATKGIDAKAIYGMRFTPGWFGFGPFPNRNHTASLLAMGALVGCGCLTWLVRRRQWGGLALGGGMLLVTLVALLATQSRGGLVAFLAGAGVYTGLTLVKSRNRRATVAALSILVAAGGLLLAFGGPLLARFSSNAGEVSNASRVLIWKDAIHLWTDAPLLGHGVGAFASVFPLRQTIPLDNQVVLHPESSWLLWLAEFGAFPLLLAFSFVLLCGGKYVHSMFERHGSFFLLAGALAAVSALMVHALIDVPAHRWGTAAFALAALALVCPVNKIGERLVASRRIALLPLGILAFWGWPFLHDQPAWSPTTLSRTLARAQTVGVSEAELERMLRHFPLNGKLHYLIGIQQLRTHGRMAQEWSQHFQASVRLSPGSWATPMGIAQVCRSLAPGHSLHYWQIALERAGFRRDELFGRAILETKGLPGADATWAGYAERHPELLLVYAKTVSQDRGREAFERWWQLRADKKKLTQGEIDTFYELVKGWGSPEQIEQWMILHPERRSSEYRQWAHLLHLHGDDQRAWAILESAIPEPSYPPRPPAMPIGRLESTWRLTPESVVNAQALAHARSLDGNPDGAREVVLAVANREKAPQWFREKAAHLLADAGLLSEAVELLLRDK